MKQQLKQKKVLVKIYARTADDNAASIDEQYMALKMYLVNRYDLDEDRIFFISPPAKKPGANRTVEFVLVPATFSDKDVSKY